MEIKLVAIDLAKETFTVWAVDEKGTCLLAKNFKAQKLKEWLIQLKPCVVAMEACGGANYWARKCRDMGHEVRVLPAQYVKPFVLSQKNDRNDAKAIAEAAVRPSVRERSCGVKEIWQQDLQSLHRIRQRLVDKKLTLTNQLRGLLIEYGCVVPIGERAFLNNVLGVVEDAENELSLLMRDLALRMLGELRAINEEISFYDKALSQVAKEREDCKRLLKVPGVGVQTATAMVAYVGDPKRFKNGRQLAASLGLVPRQVSTGGKTRLLGISKRGDSYLRSLLVHGARASLTHVRKRQNTNVRENWCRSLYERLGHNKACVAIANKNARVMWSILATKEDYRAS